MLAWQCLFEKSFLFGKSTDCVNYRSGPRYCCQRSIGLANGQRGHTYIKFLGCCSLNFKMFIPKKILGLLQYCNEGHFCDYCRDMGHFLCGAVRNFVRERPAHLTYVRLFLPFISEQLKLI